MFKNTTRHYIKKLQLTSIKAVISFHFLQQSYSADKHMKQLLSNLNVQGSPQGYSWVTLKRTSLLCVLTLSEVFIAVQRGHT